MRTINYILVNETGNKTAVRAIANSPVSEFRHHNVIINAVPDWKVAGSNARETLIDKLCRLRRQWPSAKILGLSELVPETKNFEHGTRGFIRPSDAMNRIRRTLSDLP